MHPLLRKSWIFILERLSTSTLSLVLFSVIIPVIVFGITSVYAWRTSGSHAPLGRILAGAIAPTAISIAVTSFALLCLLGWGIVATLHAEYASLRKTISEREMTISRLQAELDEAAALKAQQSKLVIHSAVYGTGKFDDVPVTDSLSAIPRDGLVIPVDNNLVAGRPDPAPNQPKRLIVEYSYGNSTKHTVVRPESQPGYPSRLVLPEDSDILHLTNEMNVVKQIALSATESQRGLQNALSEAENKHREEVASLSKDWTKVWKEQSEKFQKLSHSGIRADWHDTSAGAGWRICGGDVEGNRYMEVLCRLAGNLLTASPRISTAVPPDIQTQLDPAWKWLYYMKQAGIGYEAELLGAYEIFEGDKKRLVHAGTIRNLGGESANLCLDLAAREV